MFSHTTGLAPRNAVEQKLLEIATASSIHAVGGPLLLLPHVVAGSKVEGKPGLTVDNLSVCVGGRGQKLASRQICIYFHPSAMTVRSQVIKSYIIGLSMYHKANLFLLEVTGFQICLLFLGQ